MIASSCRREVKGGPGDLEHGLLLEDSMHGSTRSSRGLGVLWSERCDKTCRYQDTRKQTTPSCQ
ncbi:hypothetical protein T440DRAFT_269516 [Plenodomus tracheiphilus IPT5]|uniref:Uncharacterized protein n=1 Tax=Plenodomus tracheiphilus IPT5 TaxID=1408161 RepID=A0A6A7BF78_9PLEO|nr:hypothetical protein T440DRAFT_269516 [Plenodomus tracheiphilus IPT5]